MRWLIGPSVFSTRRDRPRGYFFRREVMVMNGTHLPSSVCMNDFRTLRSLSLISITSLILTSLPVVGLGPSVSRVSTWLSTVPSYFQSQSATEHNQVPTYFFF